MRSQLLLIAAILHPFVDANVRFSQELTGKSVPCMEKLRVKWGDDGHSPTIEELLTYTLDLYAGGNDQSHYRSIAGLVSNGRFSSNGEVAMEVEVIIPRNVGVASFSAPFFLCMNATRPGSGYTLRFSDRFLVGGATGQLDIPVGEYEMEGYGTRGPEPFNSWDWDKTSLAAGTVTNTVTKIETKSASSLQGESTTSPSSGPPPSSSQTVDNTAPPLSGAPFLPPADVVDGATPPQESEEPRPTHTRTESSGSPPAVTREIYYSADSSPPPLSTTQIAGIAGGVGGGGLLVFGATLLLLLRRKRPETPDEVPPVTSPVMMTEYKPGTENPAGIHRSSRNLGPSMMKPVPVAPGDVPELENQPTRPLHVVELP
ncbi:hypothetical protein P152DRAFT_473912 [Eremomyces bilateralis CBS 781.70]|uniref:Uncharacterized protein n=1 Tax=Eremomyces bilateralis CBS 781.70 TaxID=1392243 RepID=A0A6G1G2P3_9PEZI|nr:uncharacterized protein P152DRAFT_473912 [Eremomyces bilateralis CBS 781.70]KAF1812190.1 hypothetical protein P152DRAFT_473912 [Eremomyces bilateralis CBS 781.70]